MYYNIYIYYYIILCILYIYIIYIHSFQIFPLLGIFTTDSICSLFTRRSGSRLLVLQAVKESKTIIWNGVLTQLALTQKLLQESIEVILGMAF
jgi:hypothetical protein